MNGYAGITSTASELGGIPFNAEDDGFAAVFGLEYSPIYRTIFLYYLILALAFLTAFVTMRLRRLPVGRAWEALREDEIACRSLGINTTNTKLTALPPAGVRGLCRFVFCCPARFHLTRLVYIPGVRYNSVDRRALRNV